LDNITSGKVSKNVREKYAEFYLNAGANRLQFDLGWSPKLVIEKHHRDSVTEAEILSVRGVYETEDDAMDAALKHGKEGIDRGFQLNRPVGK
jgi:hypothetical protein